jgi:hypothetical protein
VANTDQRTGHKPVQKRKVFYIPGYDPIGPRRYRELYRTEAKRQEEISGYELNVKGRSRGDKNYGWDVNARIDEQETNTSFEFLLWSDVVQDSQSRTILSTFFLLVRTAWIYLSTSALGRIGRTRRFPVFVALYPVFALTLQFNLALVSGYSIYVIVKLVMLWPIALGFGIFIFWMTLQIFRKLDTSFFAYYLMHDYGFSASKMGENPPELELKITMFATSVMAALDEDWDEVLIVGHSSGAHIAISVLSDVLRAVPRSRLDSGPQLSLLTLGHVVPMVSFLPKADRLRFDLNQLSKRRCITWVDITAPTDACCFALCDPAAVSGVAPDDGTQLWPLVLSAAYNRTVDPVRMEEMKTDFFKLHILYLCALDKPEQYDYFRVTAGPQTLGARFEGYQSSPKTNRTKMSTFTSMRSNTWLNR